MKSLHSILFAYTAILLGAVSMMLLMFFMFYGSFEFVDLGFADGGTLLFDTGLCLLFFVQHSLMVRPGFKRRAATVLPEQYVGGLYTITSSIFLLLLVGLWQKTDPVIAGASGIYFWFFRVTFLFSIFGFHWGTKTFSHFDPFGVKGLLKPEKYGEINEQPFVAKGPYRYVRHPLYLCTLIMIWACPEMTVDRLLFNILCTFWIVLGAVFEERDLVKHFGEEYVLYQKQVPMLFPFHLASQDDNKAWK